GIGFRPSPAVAFGSGVYGLTWATNGVNLRFANPVGPPSLTATTVVNSGSTSEYPSLASDGTDFLVSWMERNSNFDFDVRARLMRADGGAVGPIFDVANTVGVEEVLPASAAGDGRYLVAWEIDPNVEVRAAVFASDGGRG